MEIKINVKITWEASFSNRNQNILKLINSLTYEWTVGNYFKCEDKQKNVEYIFFIWKLVFKKFSNLKIHQLYSFKKQFN